YGGAAGSCGMPLEPEAPADRMEDGKSAGKPGFLFVNNFQRRRDMAEHDGVALEIPAELGGGRMPELDVCNGDFFFLPVNMRLGEAVLQASACTPLTCLHSREGVTYVFYTAARLARLSQGDRLYTASTVRCLQDVDGRLYRFDRQYAAGEHTNGDIRIATLSREDALNAVKLTCGGADYLVISDALIFSDGETVCAETASPLSFKTYPRLPEKPDGFSERALGESGFWRYEKEADFPLVKTPLMVKDECLHEAAAGKNSDAAARDTRCWSIGVGGWSGEPWDELFLEFRYTGNCARLYENGRLLDDHIYTGPDCVWEVGLSRFGKGRHELVLEVDALGEEDEIFLEKWPSFNGEPRLVSLDSVCLRGRLLERIFS
ncbi:MAG: hypothetical protein J6Y13_08820, partial [Treponema sp.]|nr:hypothetical protein [Treponema sp.]